MVKPTTQIIEHFQKNFNLKQYPKKQNIFVSPDSTIYRMDQNHNMILLKIYYIGANKIPHVYLQKNNSIKFKKATPVALIMAITYLNYDFQLNTIINHIDLDIQNNFFQNLQIVSNYELEKVRNLNKILIQKIHQIEDAQWEPIKDSKTKLIDWTKTHEKRQQIKGYDKRNPLGFLNSNQSLFNDL